MISVSEPRVFDPLVDERPARYVVGIDLGTTNSAVSFVDTHEMPWRVRDLPIPQLIAPGQVESRETLPSFHYQAAGDEAVLGALRLPWSTRDPNFAVGVWARDEGGLRAGRLIASAKSWLCHSGVDRTADLLPWHAAADVERLSPVEVSARYLRHLRDAWNAKFPHEPLAKQDIVLTLPASFDEVARELTIEAAARAELPRVVLIEEPQAAFYAWVYRRRDDWHERVEPGQTILICDIGGGTTDFTLLRVRRGNTDTDQVQFHRVAVGDHLILGGDNLDLALARRIEERLSQTRRLEPRQWETLVRICRTVKETLLSDGAPDTMTVHLPGAGAKVIGGGLDIEVTRDEVRELLVEGFLPRVPLDALPQRRQSGFQEFGLPYAPDPAITRYLAQFLQIHRSAGLDESASRNERSGRPDAILLNGGFFASPILRDRLLAVVASWFREEEELWTPQLLDHDRLDLAVARGAAYYGMVRRGLGVRITANAARSYYVGVESQPPAVVCLLPGDAAPGEDVRLPGRTFLLTVSEPVEFPLYVSSTRLTDRPGELIAVQTEQMRPLPPIRTVIRTQRRGDTGAAHVELHARLSEIGTIELWCNEVGRDRSWRLQFDVRSATQTDVAARETAGEAAGFVDEETWRDCAALIAEVFGPEGQAKPDSLMKRLGQRLGASSQEWPPSLLRRMWETLLQHEAGRRRSTAHEARWLNLAGFALRPGYGVAVDDWRVAETWRTIRGKLSFPAGSSRIESLILWRRIAGGLSSGQQRAIIEPLLAPLRDSRRRTPSRRGSNTPRGDSPEMWTLLASLELLPIATKIEFGDIIADLLRDWRGNGNSQSLIWALGRLGQRVPQYGPLNTVLPSEKAAEWLGVLLSPSHVEGVTALSVMQLTRLTDDRYRDLDESARKSALNWLAQTGASEHLVRLVREVGRLDAEEQKQVFGESLPKGLRIV